MAAQTRESLLDAAGQLIKAGQPVKLSEVAALAGVSRQTLYNEFGSRDRLLEALSLRVGQRVLAESVRAAREAPGDVGDAVRASTIVGLRAATTDPLVKAGLLGPSAELLPFVTTSSGALLDLFRDACAAVLLERWPRLDPVETRWAMEMGFRLSLSHLVLPTEPIEVTAAHTAIVMRRLLGPTDPQETGKQSN
jgi:AcrR family transcriptional regulator